MDNSSKMKLVECLTWLPLDTLRIIHRDLIKAGEESPDEFVGTSGLTDLLKAVDMAAHDVYIDTPEEW